MMSSKGMPHAWKKWSVVSKEESVDFIRNARQNWESGINEELLAIGNESKRPLLLIRYLLLMNPHFERKIS